MQIYTQRQCKKFGKARREQRNRARDMCDKTGCYAVYYGYADYRKDNSVKHYELFLIPLDKQQYDQLDAETCTNFPDRALFVLFER